MRLLCKIKREEGNAHFSLELRDVLMKSFESVAVINMLKHISDVFVN